MPWIPTRSRRSPPSKRGRRTRPGGRRRIAAPLVAAATAAAVVASGAGLWAIRQPASAPATSPDTPSTGDVTVETAPAADLPFFLPTDVPDGLVLGDHRHRHVEPSEDDIGRVVLVVERESGQVESPISVLVYDGPTLARPGSYDAVLEVEYGHIDLRLDDGRGAWFLLDATNHLGMLEWELPDGRFRGPRHPRRSR